MHIDEVIKNTEYDFIPLDKMIPLKTAVNMFEEEYKRVNKSYFDRKYQRLREIYFSLFVCKALDAIKKKEHHLFFTKRQDRCDVSFISIDEIDKNGIISHYDVKEYVNGNDSFEIFLNHVVKKSRYKDYNLIIGTHIGTNIRIDLNSIDKNIFFISSIDDKDEDKYLSRVKFLFDKEMVFDEEVNLNYLIDKNLPNIIFHDKLRIKENLPPSD